MNKLSCRSFPCCSFFATLFAALPLLLISPDASAEINEHRPVCSADGSRLIYGLKSEQTSNDWELYVMDLDSQVLSRLTTHPGWDGYAVWSPDGTKIIYHREDTPGGRKRPWIMDIEDRTSKPLGRYEGQMSITDWSKDNQLLGVHELAGQRDLLVMDADGTIVESLTTTSGYSEHDAHFSPDGKSIVYANSVIDGSRSSLELIDLESGDKTTLRSSSGKIYGISWSPDGEKIAFVDTPSGGGREADIFVYTIAEQGFRQVTNNASLDHMPAFCNNSKTLFFTSFRSGTELIYRIDPDPTPYLRIERAHK